MNRPNHKEIQKRPTLEDEIDKIKRSMKQGARYYTGFKITKNSDGTWKAEINKYYHVGFEDWRGGHFVKEGGIDEVAEFIYEKLRYLNQFVAIIYG